MKKKEKGKTSSSNITLDTWLKQEHQKDKSAVKIEENKTLKDSVKKSSYLSRLIEEFENKIQMPEIIDKNKYYSLQTIIKTRFPKKILVITEKPKVAQALARSLSSKSMLKKQSGKLRVYDLFFNGIKVTIVPLRGHLVELITRKDFSGRWENSDPKAIITEKDAIIEKVKDKEIEDVLKREAMNADLFIIATDADEEGANIGYEAYKIVKSVKDNIQTLQLWFLSLDKKELLNAFLKPIEPKWSWALSVEARRYIDAIVGFASTRELTLYLKEQLDRMGLKVASIGRVQTPTLYLIYLREKEIEEFQPKPYWVIVAITMINGSVHEFRHVLSPIYVKEKAENIFKKIKNVEEGVVREINENVSKTLPPTPLNTTKALSELNRLFGIPSNTAMKILEDLYLNGLITYPRTDTDKYPKDYNHEETIRKISEYPKISRIAEEVLKKGAKLRRNGRKLVGDHLPITPIDYPRENDKRIPNEKYLLVYEFVLRRYLALFMDPAVISKREIIIDIKGEAFKARDTRIVEMGFYKIYNFDIPTENTIPVSSIGEKIRIKEIELRKDKTKPPPPLTEFELIKLMERLGLGTKSTRPEHIQKLVDRRYIVRKNKNLKITEIGKTIMKHLETIWPDFVKPYFSAKIHTMMRHVMNGEITHTDMIENARKEFLQLFEELRRHLNEHGSKIINAYELELEKMSVTKCPKCSGSMIKKEISKKAYKISCINCKFEVVVPKFRKLERLDGIKCKICGSNPVILHRKRKIFACLVCISNIGPCFKCPKKEECDIGKLLRKEEEKYTVGKCDQCGSVAIYVPEKRYVLCKNCSTSKIYPLPKEGRLSLTKKIHEKCGWRLFKVSKRGLNYYFCALCKERV